MTPAPEPQADSTTSTRNETESADMGTWDDNEHRRAARQQKAEKLADYLAGNATALFATTGDTTASLPEGAEGLRMIATLLQLARVRKSAADKQLWTTLADLAGVNPPSWFTQQMVIERLEARANAAHRPFAGLPA